ncbi:hypothetical protein N7520_011752 [Penicillium odoratum]|uniref:uncharacterized protein n=1 Tax=Penicillium odoratum TaxID=1167516 RepID=UPI0025497657|nr:uncharacterized protein N7520_011752 [Penicillium odoratum]KAJ5746570.1 hypothetical protein N7520_011752 [Penicillium odoratum]
MWSTEFVARAYSLMGQWRDSEALHVKIIDICNQKLGPEDTVTLFFMAALALNYRKEGKLKDAEALQLKVFEVEMRKLGRENNFHTLQTMDELSAIYYRQGRWQEGGHMHLLVQRNHRILGKENPKYFDTDDGFDIVILATRPITSRGNVTNGMSPYEQACSWRGTS